MGTFNGEKRSYFYFIGKWFIPYIFVAFLINTFTEFGMGVIPYWVLVTADWYFFNGKPMQVGKEETAEGSVTGQKVDIAERNPGEKAFKTLDLVSKYGCLTVILLGFGLLAALVLLILAIV